MEQAQEIIRGIQRGLLQWYDFKPDSMILYTGSEEDAIAEMLRERAGALICVSCGTAGEENFRQNYGERFDYIVSVAAASSGADTGRSSELVKGRREAAPWHEQPPWHKVFLRGQGSVYTAEL